MSLVAFSAEQRSIDPPGTTSTPQNAYYDTGLSLPLPNPYTLDADARIPSTIWLDGQITGPIVDSKR